MSKNVVNNIFINSDKNKIEKIINEKLSKIISKSLRTNKK